MKVQKDPELKFLVKKGDVDKVRELIRLGNTDPNYLEDFVNNLWRTQMTPNHVDIFKLFLDSGAVVNQKVVDQFSTTPNSEHCTEIFTCILDRQHDMDSLRMIFESILKFTDRQQSTNILNLLLDWGLPVDELLDSKHNALHKSILTGNTDFMSLLIQRGADLEKRTSNIEFTPLGLATTMGSSESVEILLKSGANVNENSFMDLKTALHSASIRYNGYPVAGNKILILLRYGASLDALNFIGETPLQCAPVKRRIRFSRKQCFFNKYILLKEVARLRFEEQDVSKQNLEYIQSYKTLRIEFKKYLAELKKMNNCNFYGNTSLYDILKMRCQLTKLIQLTKNQDFVDAYDFAKNKVPLLHYGEHLDDIFEKAVRKRDTLLAEEKKLHISLKNTLPDLVIRKLAQFTAEVN